MIVTENTRKVNPQNYADNPERRTILLSGAHVKRRKYSPPPPKHYVLDIGKVISLQMLAKKFGWGDE